VVHREAAEPEAGQERGAERGLPPAQHADLQGTVPATKVPAAPPRTSRPTHSRKACSSSSSTSSRTRTTRPSSNGPSRPWTPTGTA
jgi:hypothetical protein